MDTRLSALCIGLERSRRDPNTCEGSRLVPSAEVAT